jgi:hypothetical protein
MSDEMSAHKSLALMRHSTLPHYCILVILLVFLASLQSVGGKCCGPVASILIPCSSVFDPSCDLASWHICPTTPHKPQCTDLLPLQHACTHVVVYLQSYQITNTMYNIYYSTPGRQLGTDLFFFAAMLVCSSARTCMIHSHLHDDVVRVGDQRDVMCLVVY